MKAELDITSTSVFARLGHLSFYAHGSSVPAAGQHRDRTPGEIVLGLGSITVYLVNSRRTSRSH